MKIQIETNRDIPNILLVDDIPANLKLLHDILKDQGYKTRPVPNGKLALQAAEKEKPDLILLDIMMPEMDGFEVCRRLKENPGMEDIPVIFISALDDTSDILKALEVGGVDYINKPFQAEEVKARVRTHIQLSRQSKELKKLKQAVEQSPVTVIITDLDGTIVYANPKAFDITGYTPGELVGQNPRILKSGEMSDAGYLKMWETIRSGKEWKGEFHNKKKNGELFWESAAISPVTDTQGNITQYLAIKEDITERKSAEKEINDLNANLELKVEERTLELREVNKNLENNILALERAKEEIIISRDEARKANLVKSEFLSRVSHELRTPMNSILGFAQLLSMGELTQKQQKSVNYIFSSGKHLLGLIDEVLDISGLDTGKFSLLPEPVQLGTVITEIVEITQPLLSARQLTLRVENPPPDQLYVMTDRQRLKQVLINLYSNAVKFNRQGGDITLKTEMLPMNAEGIVFVRVSVTDTGLGISSDDLPNLFVPFGQIGPESNQAEGAGLGLAIVKKIMDAMGGLIGVKSIVGEGSTFWIEMPTTENRIFSGQVPAR